MLGFHHNFIAAPISALSTEYNFKCFFFFKLLYFNNEKLTHCGLIQILHITFSY